MNKIPPAILGIAFFSACYQLVFVELVYVSQKLCFSEHSEFVFQQIYTDVIIGKYGPIKFLMIPILTLPFLPILRYAAKTNYRPNKISCLHGAMVMCLFLMLVPGFPSYHQNCEAGRVGVELIMFVLLGGTSLVSWLSIKFHSKR